MGPKTRCIVKIPHIFLALSPYPKTKQRVDLGGQMLGMGRFRTPKKTLQKGKTFAKKIFLAINWAPEFSCAFEVLLFRLLDLEHTKPQGVGNSGRNPRFCCCFYAWTLSATCPLS